MNTAARLSLPFTVESIHILKRCLQPSSILAAIIILAVFGSSCTNPAVTKIFTPAVQTQVIGDLEKDVIAGGGALLVTKGDTGAAVAAITAQELKNLPDLQAKLAAANAATTPTAKVPSTVTP
jgi:hypothetical protein